MTRFDPAYPLESLRPAEYNPRHMSKQGADRLAESITRFGVQKPVVVNGSGTLVAGHQRIKALKRLGWETIPAVILDQAVPVQDEIWFNLMHNSIETDRTHVSVPALEAGWRWIPAAELTVGSNLNAVVIKEICRLLTRYGPWGNVIADTEGRVVSNGDYAYACKLLGVPVLAAVLAPERARELVEWLGGDYGVYAYDALGVKGYNQMLCQPHRGTWRSAPTYTKLVTPKLRPGDRLVDFGAGECQSVHQLRKAGWDAYAYEPHLRQQGSKRLDIAGVVRQIALLRASLQRHGQFDHVVLDAVLNSVTSVEFEHHVLMCCNALCAGGGRFVMSTRSMGTVEANMRRSRATGEGKEIEFLDAEGFSAVYREGVWTLQRFMTKATLEKTLSRYFGEVKVLAGKMETDYLRAVCQKPLPLDLEDARESLGIEFNMEYPGGYHHGKHAELVELLLRLTAEREARTS